MPHACRWSKRVGRGSRLLFGLILLTGCESRRTPDSSPYLAAAIGVAEWLRMESGDGTGASIPDRIGGGETSSTLGSGAAGRAIFFAELFAATRDTSYRTSAITTARAALSGARGSSLPNGLYNGWSGVAASVSEVATSTRDSTLRGLARQAFHRVARANDVGPGDGWGDGYDVLNGRAGIGLAMLYAFREFGDSVFLNAAMRAGDSLLGVAVSAGDGTMHWVRSASIPLNLPNFSHGTAGVGFFMARLADATGELSYRIAAVAAAGYLNGIADRRDSLFLIPYGVPNEGYATQHDIGWAHGPAGTARLHYVLWLLTAEPEARSLVEASARTLVASGLPGSSAEPALWTGPFRIDRRFGTSGAAVFLLEWASVSSNPSYQRAATRIVDDILDRATRTDSGVYWTVPQYGFQGSGEDAVFTGYFYGAAGLGLTLLRQHYAMHDDRPRVRLPDDPYPSGPE